MNVYHGTKTFLKEGLLKAIFTLGDVQVEITPSGIVNWEQKTDLHEDFDAAINIEAINSLANESSEMETSEARTEIYEKLQSILCFTEKVKEEHPDLDIDARILNLEFHKIRPDQEIILTKLHTIDQLPSIRKEVRYLKEALR